MSCAPKILIIDDEPRMCDSLRALLSGQGYEIHTASGGKGAIGYLAGNSFDLVLLDIVLPDMDGCQVMHYIDSQDLETIVIVMTGHASVKSAIDALRSGAYDYLRKPFEHEQLLKTVGNALEQKRLKSERKHAEEALRESEEKYRMVLEASPDAIVVYDMEGTVIYLNRAFTRVFGWTPKELLGRGIDYVPDENRPETKMMIDKVLAGESFSGIKSRRYTKQRKILDVSISVAT